MSPERDEAPTMRREPRRARGQQRVAAILDAAEALFAEGGFEATTTNEIAARAGIPIGSVYQFFPNKEAILHAAAARYLEGFAAIYEQLLAEGLADLPLAALVDRLVDALVQYGGEHIGVTRTVLVGHGSPHVAPAAAALHHDLAGRLEQLLAARAPHLPPERRALVTSTALTALLALLSSAVAAKYTVSMDAMLAMFAESKLLLLAYLRAALGAAPDEAQPPG